MNEVEFVTVGGHRRRHGGHDGDDGQLCAAVQEDARAVRAFDAYKNLNKRIEDFQIVLPLLQELAKPSVMVRHWDELHELW